MENVWMVMGCMQTNKKEVRASCQDDKRPHVQGGEDALTTKNVHN